MKKILKKQYSSHTTLTTSPVKNDQSSTLSGTNLISQNEIF